MDNPSHIESVRIGTGRFYTAPEIDAFLEVLKNSANIGTVRDALTTFDHLKDWESYRDEPNLVKELKKLIQMGNRKGLSVSFTLKLVEASSSFMIKLYVCGNGVDGSLMLFPDRDGEVKTIEAATSFIFSIYNSSTKE